MGVAMSCVNRDPAFAGLRGALDVAGTESERLAARAREHDGADADPLHRDARLRPGIRPGPRLDGAAGGEAFGKGALQQHLREHRLGMDENALPEQDRAGARKNNHNELAAHHSALFSSFTCATGCEKEGARPRGMAARHGQGLGGVGG